MALTHEDPIPQTFDDVFRDVLRTVLERGERTELGAGLSVGNGRTTTELRNHAFTVHDTRDRLLYSGKRFDLRAAVGRFAWMMSGSDRLADIQYYDPNARRFSDDGITVPGSCDGARILYARRGVNQLQKVIQVLRDDPSSRRASMAIYQPEDAGRQSKDIPCVLSATYNIRQDRLHTTTVLRSSNAARVLPYDLFLYSMVSEVVASEVGVDLGSYHQFAVSLHIYDSDVALAESICATESRQARPEITEMPRGTALRDISVLLEHERLLRTRVAADVRWAAEMLDRIDAELPPYWQDFSLLLLSHAIERGPALSEAKNEVATMIATRLGPAFRAIAAPASTSNSGDNTLRL